jgi:hypothetical protein
MLTFTHRGCQQRDSFDIYILQIQKQQKFNSPAALQQQP